MKFQVKGTKDGKRAEKGFHCIEDARRFADECGWEDVEIAETVERVAKGRTSLHGRAVDATERFFSKLGYEVVETGFECPAGTMDVIAYDGDVLVFNSVDAKAGFEQGFSGGGVGALELDVFERVAAWYLSECDDVDVPIRFDKTELLVVNDGRAFMKHHVNVVAQ